jgi:ethanolamine ammonia-lyase small subunit
MAIDLRAFTPARVALGRSGHSLPTAEMLRFQLDHARARDAVYQDLNPAWLDLPHILLRSAARDRRTYLRRPDLGRILSEESRAKLTRGDYDAAVVIADGLSAPAIHRHAAALLEIFMPKLAEEGWRLAPLVAVLIGERPGLTSPDSLGIYLTWDPRPGRTDAERNCISNVRTEGLSYAAAAQKLLFLMREARARKLSGLGLKEDAKLIEPPTL